MSLLQLFLVMFPEDYIEKVLIPDTNKGLSVPMYLQDYIQWVGCWLYMACWVRIESRSGLVVHNDTQLMAKGFPPFRLNHIMSRKKRFDSIISALHFNE